MIYLIEVQAHDGSTVRTIYLATDGYTSKPSDNPPSQYYMPRIEDAGLYEEHIFSGGDGVSGGTTRGEASAGAGDIKVTNGSPYGGGEYIDEWMGWNFTGFPIVIKTVDDAKAALTSAQTVYTGKVARLDASNALDGFSIVMWDRLSDLDKPLLTSRFLGTTTSGGIDPGAEGNEDLKDQVKQEIWGRKNNATGALVNEFELIHRWCSNASSITVYDGAYPLTNAGNFGSLAALRAAVLVPGQYATCLLLGLSRLGGQPVFTVTADVVEGATVGDRTPAQIARRMLLHFGITVSELVLASFTALDLIYAPECGVMVSADETATSALGRLLGPLRCYLLPNNLGQFKIGRFNAPGGAAINTFGLSDNIGGQPELIPTGDEDDGVPSKQVVIKYDQLGVTMDGSQTVGNITQGRRDYLALEWRESASAVVPITTKYPSAGVLTIETCLVNQAQAASLATDYLSLYSVQRKMFRMRLPQETAKDCLLGTEVELKEDRLGMDEGQDFIVTGRTVAHGNANEVPLVTLELWG